MKNKFLLLAGICLLGFSLGSCDKDDPEPDPDVCETTGVTYTNDIKAIFDSNCANSGCHSSAELLSRGSLETYAEAVVFVAFGRLEGAINHSSGFSPMPYPSGSDKLADCDIDKIEAWIADGTPE